MKKLFIGLLVIAAGTGIYFYFNQKASPKPPQDVLKKELIIGNWKNGQQIIDTALPNYNYEFLKNGIVLRSKSDSTKVDSIHYEWDKNDALVIKEKLTDSTGKLFTVVKLTIDSLQLKPEDKTATSLFTKRN